VLVHEGGFVNHPKDPGGRTLEGVIQRVYDGYRQNKNKPLQTLRKEMRGTTAWNKERNEIYKLQYWNKIQGDRLPAGVDYVVFDGAVNSGPGQSVKWLQRALGVEVDGLIGEATIRAANDHPDHDALVAEILARRLGMLKSLKTWKTFGKGWSNRVAEAKAIGQAMASGSVGPEPTYIEGGEQRARIEDAAMPLAVAEITGTGGMNLGGTAVLNAAKEQLTPLLGTSHTIDTVFTVLTVATAALGIAGLLYGAWATWHSKKVQKALDGEVLAWS
jgi:lysozyme family protein